MSRISAHPSPFHGWFCLHICLRQTSTDERAGCVSQTRDSDMSRMRSARELSGHQSWDSGSGRTKFEGGNTQSSVLRALRQE